MYGEITANCLACQWKRDKGVEGQGQDFGGRGHGDRADKSALHPECINQLILTIGFTEGKCLSVCMKTNGPVDKADLPNMHACALLTQRKGLLGPLELSEEANSYRLKAHLFTCPEMSALARQNERWWRAL